MNSKLHHNIKQKNELQNLSKLLLQKDTYNIYLEEVCDNL